MPKQETTTRFTKQRWFESNDYGKEAFVDELLASHGFLLAALEDTADTYHRQLCPDKYGETFTVCPYSRCIANAAAIAQAKEAK